MENWSRRDALQSVATSGAILLAGCSGETDSSSSFPSDRSKPVSKFEITFVRDTNGEPLFTKGDSSRDVSGLVQYLTNPDQLDTLTFKGTPPADELKTFIEATDFDTESVYLIERPTGECYELGLVNVYREADGISVEFCQRLRPADVECSSDTDDMVGIAMRLPFEGDSFSKRGFGGRSRCDQLPVIAWEGVARK